ncbi:MAG: SH3 domain-containing protein, partial [Myxococcales bacterium]|nr:SH3 domain-containing protein [Myxococcales bacterium]
MSEFAPREPQTPAPRAPEHAPSSGLDVHADAAWAQAAGAADPRTPAELQSAELITLSALEPAICVAPESLPGAVNAPLRAALTAVDAGRPRGTWARVTQVKPWLTLRRDRDPRPIDGRSVFTAVADPLVEALLRFNDRLWVIAEFSGNWLQVRTDDGKTGYVDRNYLILDPPEPDAQLYRTQSGDTALAIAQAHYDCGEWGADGRFFVNVLALINGGEGDPRQGLYKRDAGAEWHETEVRAGYWIWLPSPAFANTLRGQVDSGSISHEALDLAVAGTAFEVGWLKGSLEGMSDAITGLVDAIDLVWDILDKAFQGTLTDDLADFIAQ